MSFHIGDDGDADAAIDLLHLSYLWHVAALQRRDGPVLLEVDVASDLAALDFGPRVEAAFGRVLARESA